MCYPESVRYTFTRGSIDRKTEKLGFLSPLAFEQRFHQKHEAA